MPLTFCYVIDIIYCAQSVPSLLLNYFCKLLFLSYLNGDPGLIRTADTQFRKLLLYPPELRGHV